MKEQLRHLVYAECPELCDIADQIFDHPEQCFKEVFACDILCDWLARHGYRVEKGVGGLETAFRAEWSQGEGGPSVGLLAEYDALPMGHACGHHLQGPVLFAAAEAIKKCGIKEPFKIVIYGTPAEEGGWGKYYMAQAGCFRDIDIALMTHAAPYTTVDIMSQAISTFKVTYTGHAAHEAMTPEKSRSGLDAILLAYQGIQFMRGRVKNKVLFQCRINDCDGMPDNTDMFSASGTVRVRTHDYWDMPELEERVTTLFQGAAMMTGTTVRIAQSARCVAKVPSYSLNKVFMDNAALIDAPNILAYRKKTGGTDFAHVTHMMPAAVSRFPIVPWGSPSHSQAFLDNGKGEVARRGVEIGAQIIALSMYDVIADPSLLEEMRAEYANRKAEYDHNMATRSSGETETENGTEGVVTPIKQGRS